MRQAVADAGQQIEPAAARLVAERAGTDIATLRGDVERLLLYAAGKPKIDLKDVQEVVSAETAQDDWAVTTAIQRGDTAEALRQLGLALESGGVPYMILGQLGWFVREKLPDIGSTARARRRGRAVPHRYRLEKFRRRSARPARATRRRAKPPLISSRRGWRGATCSGRRCCGE